VSRHDLRSDDTEKDDWARPISRESLSERAYGELRAALMRGRLKPGERLLLRPTSARFGISATPMREALLRLVSERALSLDARGTVIVPRLTRDQLLEIRTIRMDLEGRAAGRAAELASEADISALAAIHDEIAQCHRSDDFDRAIGLNTRFHLELCRLGRMPILLEIIEGLWVRCGPLLSHLYDAGLPDWEPHPHLRVIAALQEGSADAAAEAIREDIEHGGRGLFDHVDQSNAQEVNFNRGPTSGTGRHG
jgi:DNA-binding GntR family transcriptional regulator